MAKTVKIGPYSAYAIAVAAGYQGTEQEWLESLVGPQGPGITRAILDSNSHLILTVHDPATGQDSTLDAGAIDTSAAVESVTESIRQAGQQAAERAETLVQQATESATAAADSASDAAQSSDTASSAAAASSQSASQAAESATAARQAADTAASSRTAAEASAAAAANSAQAGSQQAAQAVTSANAAAQSAASALGSAQAAQEAAQQAVGFRHLFSALSPDENGDLDPSRPMTTPTAQTSWTIKSKGDRIQTVQVNGFTQKGASGGLQMVRLELTGSESWNFKEESGPGNTFRLGLSLLPRVADREITAYFALAIPVSYDNRGTYTGNWRVYTIEGNQLVIRLPQGDNMTLDEFKAMLQTAYDRGTPYEAYYVPADVSQATGLYMPVQVFGHAYRCKCLPLTKALAAGDNVQSKAPSGCDASFVLDGSQNINWIANGSAPHGGIFQCSIKKALPTKIGEKYENLYSDKLISIQSGYANYEYGTMTTSDTGNSLNFMLFSDMSAEEAKQYLASNPITIWYKSTEYNEKEQRSLQTETHSNGNIYAHTPVEIEAVPYTSDDSGKTPGTYEVSSQDGTTVQVSLKAMQDGGNAATLAGHTWSDIQKLISDAVASAVALSQ